uniref:Polycystin cation channel PKD1/PKD2 domain-containing protein n=1 Tax=Pyramimonas obovata TaxID=1411642 RepID=A0A7S0QUI0_9CHLO|mmetsp:Transcript_12260/g.25742  ORF Transcript_12260/g.25742 Transcript_12260/m.25742 type:complete len:341 (+) Transcript_12260:1354-2376(+)
MGARSFQPRVGVLTRTILKGLDDLLHFAFVLCLVFIIYAMVGLLIFGPTVQRFSTFLISSRTVFAMMLGEFADPMSELFDENVAAGVLLLPKYLFFYSFMGVVFLVLLNFLLTIIVDAFIDVKNGKEGDDKISMYQELYKYVRNFAVDRMRKERQIDKIERDLNKLSGDRSCFEPEKRSFKAKTGKGLTSDAVDNTELAVVMKDESYLVKMNQQLLGSVLETDAETGLLNMEDVDPHAFAGKVIDHFGRPLFLEELELPILHTSESEQIKEVVDIRTTAIDIRVERVEGRQEELQRNVQAMQKQLDEILRLLEGRPPPASSSHSRAVRKHSSLSTLAEQS